MRKDSEEAGVLAARYTWTLPNGNVVDPTLNDGSLPDVLFALGGLIKVPTLLALTNEPPVNYDVNLIADVTDDGVNYVADRGKFFSVVNIFPLPFSPSCF